MFSRQNAVLYAEKWWNKRNPNFYNFDELGGDCTNFVSQCLYFGGISMNTMKNGWFYFSLSHRSPSWTGVDEFFDFATNNNSFSGVRAKQTNINQVEIADVVQLKLIGEEEFHHTLLITDVIKNSDGDVTPKEVLIACHTYDAYMKPLEEYNFDKIRFLKILNN